MGAARHTELGLTVVRVDTERNLLFVRGAIPGAKNGIVTVAKQEARAVMIEAQYYTSAGAKRMRVLAPGGLLRRHRERAGAAPGGEGVPEQPASGHRQDQDPKLCLGRQPEALEAKGHRPRAAGLDPAPHWRGGGIVFGPIPRDYRTDIPRKVKQLARKSALNARAREGALHVVERFAFRRPKTARRPDCSRASGSRDEGARPHRRGERSRST